MRLFAERLADWHRPFDHLPIGIVAALAAIEVWAIVRRRRGVVISRTPFAIVAASGGALAVITGTAAAATTESTGHPIELHRWLAIASAVFTCDLARLAQRLEREGGTSTPYRLTLLVATFTMIGAAATGRIGESNAPSREAAPTIETKAMADASSQGEEAANSDVATVDPAADAAWRILASRCFSCHGDERMKGGLSLASRDAMLAGGDSGAAMIPGDPASSLLLQRLRLPLEDDDHMPPKSKSQPTPVEIEAIASWIARGGANGSPEAMTASTTAMIDSVDSTPAIVRGIPFSEDEMRAIDALREALVDVSVLDAAALTLGIGFEAAVRTGNVDDAFVSTLTAPLRERIVRLSIARAAIGRDGIASAAAMPHLERLDLRFTRVGDGDIAPLASNPSITTLNLAGTKVTDGALETLASLPALERLYLWDSAVSKDGIAELRARRPSVLVDFGDGGDAAALETEDPVAFSSEAPSPDAAPGAAGIATGAKSPSNTACPITGSPIDPSIVVEHDGKTIAFCCPKCLAKFRADPNVIAPR